MEKLLHERLREYLDRSMGVSNVKSLENVISFDHLLNRWADEIERYYIPRPRFEDGNPVQFKTSGKDILWDDKDPSWKFNAISEKGIPMAIRILDICARAEMTDEGFVKRPTPKVYDADGVEIKVGDIVYLAADDGSVEFIVECLPAPNAYQAVQVVSGGVHTSYDPPRLTHERPVFDAEGERIRKGDTVWRVDDGLEMRVIGVGDEALAESCEVFTEIDGKKPYHYNGKELTHREPDSLAKLRDEIAAWCASNSLATSETRSWSDRLTALIERGA